MTDADRIRARLAEVRASPRMRDVLVGVALDVLHPYASEYLAAVDYRRLIGLVEPSASAIAAATIDLLAEELDRLLASGEADSERRVGDLPSTMHTGS